MSTGTPAWQKALQARWAALGRREQGGLRLAALAIAAALLWSLALAPALRTLRAAPATHAELAAASERMLALRARAQALQALPAVSPQEGLVALRDVINGLGKSASLEVLGAQATLKLKQLSASELAPLLAPPAGSLSSPTEVHLQRDANANPPRWSGSLVFVLPSAKPGAP